jgi:hypothetical protein
MQLPRTLLLLSFLLPGTPSLLAAGEQRVVAREVLWSGRLDALEEQHDPFAFELAPDGKGFFYYQGAPWPRLMFQPLEGAASMVGAVVPWSTLPPRIDPRDGTVYFTAVDVAESLPEPGERPRLLSLHVVKAARPGFSAERLHPSRGRAPGTFSILLDLHPSGETLLIGTGSGFRGQRLDDLSLDLHELPASGGPAAALRIRVNGRAAVRYSGDGSLIEYIPALEDPAAEIFRFERSTSRHLPPRPERGPRARRAGELEVSSFLLPHRGSIGWDGFESHEVRRPGARAGLLLEIGEEIRRLTPVRALPVSFRAGRILLCGGPEDRPLLIVAEVDASALEAEAESVEPRPSPLLFDPALLEGRILAARDPAAAELLERLRDTLHTAAAEPVTALRARLRQKGIGIDDDIEQRVEVFERSPGLLRVERFLDLTPPAAEREPPAAEAARETISQVMAFDGEECWLEREDGFVERIAESLFAREVNACSLFRWLFDPAGLGERNLRFGAPAPIAPGGAGERRWKLPFAYEDGYAGELWVEERDGGVLPLSWRSPFLVPGERLRRELGVVPAEQVVGFEEWGLLKGRRAPRRLRFEGGFRAHLLELQEIAFPEDIDEKQFSAPARRGAAKAR